MAVSRPWETRYPTRYRRSAPATDGARKKEDSNITQRPKVAGCCGRELEFLDQNPSGKGVNLRFNLFKASHQCRLASIVFLIVGLLCSSSFSQAPTREKPKLKDFGSSLRKLKWDPQKNQAVNNAQPGPNRNNDDDVIRIETSLVVCDVLI